MSNITERKNFRVVIVGAFTLAINAGFIGALSLAGLHSATVTHVTGNIAKTGIFLARKDWFNYARISLVFLSFIFGSAISTTIVSATKTFELRRTYGAALMIEAFFLLISYLVSNREAAVTGWWWSEYFAALACGMQNAVCTSYSGAIIRTTHMTGCVTDIGIAIGQEFRIKAYLPFRKWLRTKWRSRQHYNMLEAPNAGTSLQSDETVSTETPQSAPSTRAAVSPTAAATGNTLLETEEDEPEPSVLWRLKVLIPLLLGYMLGAFIGAIVYSKIRNKALLIPSLFVGTIGFIYLIWTTILKTYKTVRSAMPSIPQIELNIPMESVAKVFTQPAAMLNSLKRTRSQSQNLVAEVQQPTDDIARTQRL